MGLLHNWDSDDNYDYNPLCKKVDSEYDGNLLVSSSMQEEIIGEKLSYENSSNDVSIVNGIMDSLRISDAALDQDINQEIGFLGEEKTDFFQYEEQKDSFVGRDK